MNLYGKIWGHTQELLTHNGVSMHRIYVREGGYCSKHRHTKKDNIFFVEQGLLEITVWKSDSKTVDTVVLREGDMTTVSAGEFHQFRACSEVIAYEIYTVSLEENDIERETTGGIQ